MPTNPYVLEAKKSNNSKSQEAKPAKTKESPAAVKPNQTSQQRKKPRREKPVVQSSPTTEKELVGAIEELVEQIMNPNKPFRMPRPTAPLVHPVNEKFELVLNPVDADSPLQGVIKINQSLDNYISVESPGASIPVVAGSLYAYVDNNDGDTEITLTNGAYYSFPAILKDSTGAKIADTVLKAVDDASGLVPENCFAWDKDTNTFKSGLVFVFECAVTSASHVTTIGIKDTVQSNKTGYSCIEFNAVEGNQLNSVLLASQNSYLGTSSPNTATWGTTRWTAVMVTPTADIVNWFQFTMTVTNVSCTYAGTVSAVYPVSSSKSFKALRGTSDKFCMSAFQATLSFEGGIASAGHVSTALVPHGKMNQAHDPETTIALISKLPGVRMYSGPAKLGAATTWLPDRLDQLWLRAEGEGVQDSQTIIFAFYCPPGGSAQPPSFRLKTTANIEFENYDPVYGAMPCCSASQLLAAIVDMYGRALPCGENPKHLKNAWNFAKKVAQDPTVRMFASHALKAGKYVLPSLLAAL